MSLDISIHNTAQELDAIAIPPPKGDHDLATSNIVSEVINNNSKELEKYFDPTLQAAVVTRLLSALNSHNFDRSEKTEIIAQIMAEDTAFAIIEPSGLISFGYDWQNNTMVTSQGDTLEKMAERSLQHNRADSEIFDGLLAMRDAFAEQSGIKQAILISPRREAEEEEEENYCSGSFIYIYTFDIEARKVSAISLEYPSSNEGLQALLTTLQEKAIPTSDLQGQKLGISVPLLFDQATPIEVQHILTLMEENLKTYQPLTAGVFERQVALAKEFDRYQHELKNRQTEIKELFKTYLNNCDDFERGVLKLCQIALPLVRGELSIEDLIPSKEHPSVTDLVFDRHTSLENIEQNTPITKGEDKNITFTLHDLTKVDGQTISTTPTQLNTETTLQTATTNKTPIVKSIEVRHVETSANQSDSLKNIEQNPLINKNEIKNAIPTSNDLAQKNVTISTTPTQLNTKTTLQTATTNKTPIVESIEIGHVETLANQDNLLKNRGQIPLINKNKNEVKNIEQLSAKYLHPVTNKQLQATSIKAIHTQEELSTATQPLKPSQQREEHLIRQKALTQYTEAQQTKLPPQQQSQTTPLQVAKHDPLNKRSPLLKNTDTSKVDASLTKPLLKIETEKTFKQPNKQSFQQDEKLHREREISRINEALYNTALKKPAAVELREKESALTTSSKQTHLRKTPPQNVLQTVVTDQPSAEKEVTRFSLQHVATPTNPLKKEDQRKIEKDNTTSFLQHAPSSTKVKPAQKQQPYIRSTANKPLAEQQREQKGINERTDDTSKNRVSPPTKSQPKLSVIKTGAIPKQIEPKPSQPTPLHVEQQQRENSFKTKRKRRAIDSAAKRKHIAAVLEKQRRAREVILERFRKQLQEHSPRRPTMQETSTKELPPRQEKVKKIKIDYSAARIIEFLNFLALQKRKPFFQPEEWRFDDPENFEIDLFMSLRQLGFKIEEAQIIIAELAKQETLLTERSREDLSIAAIKILLTVQQLLGLSDQGVDRTADEVSSIKEEERKQ
ncbi:MAG: hypothetical protein ACOX2O_00540 [Bdellovibrionota bacterium]|jgi:hypothetical protein